MNINVDKEWEFIIKEINASNKGGTIKGRLLFEPQILLDLLSRTKNSSEKRILFLIYKNKKNLYKNY